MGRSFVVGLAAMVAGLSIAIISQADHAALECITLLVLANGQASAVEHVRNTDLALEVQAGSITRSALRAELSRGIGRFLQNVKTEAVLSHGHFVGWRLLALFPK